MKFSKAVEPVTDKKLLEEGLKVQWLNASLNIQGYQFFSRLIQEIKGLSSNDKPDGIFVLHAYEGGLADIFAIPQYASPVSLIMKHSSGKSFPDVVDHIRAQGFNVDHQSGGDLLKEKLKDPEFAIEYIKSKINGRPFFISDHGGYFAHAAKAICEAFPKEQFLGFTEFTANGHLRYEKYAQGIDRPILSVAKLPLKGIADRAAGMMIQHVAEREVLRITGRRMSEFSIGIIGQGLIGRYITRTARDSRIAYISIAEIDPLLLIRSRVEGFPIQTVEDICRTRDIIFSATGQAAIKPEYYNLMKDGTIHVASTSPDDEYDLDGLLKSGVLAFEGRKDKTGLYRVVETGARLFFIANGEAANTLARSGIGDTSLFLPQAAHLIANMLVSNGIFTEPGLHELPEEYSHYVMWKYLDVVKEHTQDEGVNPDLQTLFPPRPAVA